MKDQNKKSKSGYALHPEYFIAILSKLNYSQVYIVAQANMHNHETILSLQSSVNAQLYQDATIGDWSFLAMAPILIGSFGTFSWMAAFLSEGHSIHLPYLSNLKKGSFWHPAEMLFIHDDPRIVYHDVIIPRMFTHESAIQVLERDTIFAKAVRDRVDQCPEL